MSQWNEFGVADKLREILSSVEYHHHFGGRPFITVYQLAIELEKRYPEMVEALGKETGGAESKAGGHSLPLYIGQRLSVEIRDKVITDIEGSFMGNLNLKEISFIGPDGSPVISSLTGSAYPVSMYRLRD